MDIVSHTLTGIAVGTVAASFSTKTWKTKWAIVLTGGFGGALPDLDAISLWSQFDASIGEMLNLTHSGREIYFGKMWYSHHAALHSILAPILFSCVFISIISLIRKYTSWGQLKAYWANNALFFSAFCFGFVFHLLEDMPTPASVWGGVNFLFPSSRYIGGFGKIWWWNNYDIVLIISSVVCINGLLNAIPNTFFKLRRRATVIIFVIGVTIAITQMMNRPIDFSYTGHTTKYATYERQSKEIQRELLGEKLYRFMESIDNKIPLNF